MVKLSLRVAFDHLPELTADLGRRVRRAQEKTALDVQNDWKAGVRVETGTLRRSVRVVARDERSIVVGTDVPYAPFEEYGTRRMAGSYARTKAVEKNRGPHRQAIAQALRP